MIISSLMRWLKLWNRVPATHHDKDFLRKLFYDHFIHGSSSTELEANLSSMTTRLNCWAYDLYKTDLVWNDTNNTGEEEKTYTQTLAFLRKICRDPVDLSKIDEARCIKLMQEHHNLYDLLIALENTGDASDQTWHLKNAIHHCYPKYGWLDFFVFGTLTVATGIAVYGANFDYLMITFDWFANALPQGIVWLVFTLASPSVVPFMGIAFHALILAAKFAHILYYGEALNPHKWTYLSSETLRIFLIFSGHILTVLYFGVPAMSLTISLVFISASIVELGHAIFQCYLEWKTVKTSDIQSPNYEAQLYAARVTNKKNRLAAEVGLHFGIILCLAACICCWNLFPSSLLLSLGCVLFIVFIIATEGCLKNILKGHYATMLQGDIAMISQAHELDSPVNDTEEDPLMAMGYAS